MVGLLITAENMSEIRLHHIWSKIPRNSHDSIKNLDALEKT